MLGKSDFQDGSPAANSTAEPILLYFETSIEFKKYNLIGHTLDHEKTYKTSNKIIAGDGR